MEKKIHQKIINEANVVVFLSIKHLMRQRETFDIYKTSNLQEDHKQNSLGCIKETELRE